MTESQQTDSVILGEVFDTSKVQFPHLASKNKNSAHFLEWWWGFSKITFPKLTVQAWKARSDK